MTEQGLGGDETSPVAQGARRLIVFHRGYGCETGCCGHAIAIDVPAGDDPYNCEMRSSFQFSHPWDDAKTDRGEAFRKWAEEFIRDQMGPEHVADLDWDNCVIVDD